LSTFGDRHAILSSTMLVFGFCFIGSCFVRHCAPDVSEEPFYKRFEYASYPKAIPREAQFGHICCLLNCFLSV